MAISLKEYKPLASEFTIILRSGVGGTSRTTKSELKEQAPFTFVGLPKHMPDHGLLKLPE